MDVRHLRHCAVLAIAGALAAGLACKSPTSPSTASARVTASNAVARVGDTVTFVLDGYSSDEYVQWGYFTTPLLAEVSWVPVVVGQLGVPQTPRETHQASVTFVRVSEAAQFTAEARTPGFGGDARLIASVSIGVVR